MVTSTWHFKRMFIEQIRSWQSLAQMRDTTHMFSSLYALTEELYDGKRSNSEIWTNCETRDDIISIEYSSTNKNQIGVVGNNRLSKTMFLVPFLEDMLLMFKLNIPKIITFGLLNIILSIIYDLNIMAS